MEKQYDDEEIEIDLRAILLEWRKRWWMIAAALVAGALAAGLFSRVILSPVYESTTMMYVLSKETTLSSLADLQMGTQLTQDYKVLVTSRPVLEEVISELGLDMDYEDLQAAVSINNPSDTRILTITVSNSDPVMAKTIVDEIAQTASGYIGSIMEMVPPKIVEEGQVPEYQSSPSVKRNAALGGIVGAVLVCGVLTLLVILNDTIRTEEDVERYLGLTTLALVPERGKSRKGEGRKQRSGDAPTGERKKGASRSETNTRGKRSRQ